MTGNSRRVWKAMGIAEVRRSSGVNTVDTVIVGSGFAGLGMAIRMKQQGMDDFVVLERAGEVGGTWRDNTYPGAACDVPSNLYSFSFAPNPHWSRTFSAQPEIQAYLQGCADRFGIRPHLRLDHEVRGCRWDDDTRRWTIETSQGDYQARVLISATGALSEPALPNIPGVENFEGKTFHSSRWDHDHDLSGERVAVIGTGASAIQFVPQIQPKVGHLPSSSAPPRGSCPAGTGPSSPPSGGCSATCPSPSACPGWGSTGAAKASSSVSPTSPRR